MAHPNIEHRREAVKILNGVINRPLMKKLAVQFGCTYSAIYADFISLNNTTSETIYVSPTVRKHVLKRDNYTCQYCGTTSGSIIAEHVIPYILQGVAKDFNLVASCQSCNCFKKSKVWLPLNFSLLQEINPVWADKILSLYSPR